MAIPLITTKLFIPTPGCCHVQRERLFSQLDDCLRPGCRLALISAPAGFGKTALASAWIHSAQPRQIGLGAAWLSLDEEDNDPNRFWTYVVAAFQTLDRQFGKDAQLILSSSQVSNPETILPFLINDLAHCSTPLLLVLDDFHVIEQEAILQSLAFWLDRIPSNVHLMILTRSDPHLPLARYRSRNQLLEIRQADLRFTLEEACKLLNSAMGLDLAPVPVETLQVKTEGWAAGLQMAGLALQGMLSGQAAGSSEINPAQRRENTEKFVASFSGSNRFILDYLLEEVLRRQPAAIQDFLLRTSILDRFCAALCHELTHHELTVDSSQLAGSGKETTSGSELSTVDCQLILETLERSNLFIIPLDVERCWYRYHQLFADLLRKRLRQTDPNGELNLHARASRWFEMNQLPYQAIEHAFQAQDYARAGQLLEEAGEAILKHGEYQWLISWIKKLPEEQIHSHWKLYLVQATMLASLGQLSQAEQCLQDFDKYSQSHSVNSTAEDWIPGRVAAVQALIAIFRGDALNARRNAQLALETIPKNSDTPWRAHLLIALGHINENDGFLDVARQNLADAIDAGRLAGDIYITLDATTHLVMMLCTQGRLHQASEFAQQGLQFIRQNGLDRSAEASMLLLGWGFILCEQHLLDEAGDMIQKSLEICRRVEIPAMLGWAYYIYLRYLIAVRDWPAAEAMAQEAARIANEIETPVWIANSISAHLAQVWIREGKVNKAEGYLRDRGIFAAGEMKAIHQPEYASLARLMLAKGELDGAEHLVQLLLKRSQENGLVRLVISTMIQLALVQQARGDLQAALQSLDGALELAEPEGYLQLFLDEAVELAGLLKAYAGSGMHAAFAVKIIGAAEGADEPPAEKSVAELHRPAAAPASSMPVLSKREMEVLSLLVEGLSNKEIAQRLFISLRTVKYHTTNIFTKLNVENRTQAVFQARAQNIL